MKATATFKPTKWDEKTYDKISSDQKLTKCSVIFTFDAGGEIEGVAKIEWLMYYSHSDDKDQHNATASYLGLSRIVCKLNGKDGSFVVEERGTFENGEAKSEGTILPNSGTGELAGISGTAKSFATPTQMHFEVEYEIA